jgi:plasmid stability protein
MGAINLRNVPDDIHKAIRVQAAKQDKSIKQYLLDLAKNDIYASNGWAIGKIGLRA